MTIEFGFVLMKFVKQGKFGQIQRTNGALHLDLTISTKIVLSWKKGIETSELIVWIATTPWHLLCWCYPKAVGAEPMLVGEFIVATPEKEEDRLCAIAWRGHKHRHPHSGICRSFDDHLGYACWVFLSTFFIIAPGCQWNKQDAIGRTGQRCAEKWSALTL